MKWIPRKLSHPLSQADLQSLTESTNISDSEAVAHISNSQGHDGKVTFCSCTLTMITVGAQMTTSFPSVKQTRLGEIQSIREPIIDDPSVLFFKQSQIACFTKGTIPADMECPTLKQVTVITQSIYVAV